MKNIFNTVKMTNVDSNVFDMSYDFKLSLNMGELIPVHCQDVLPGDVIKMSTSSLHRMAPMLAPVMHKVDVYTHSFFVPNRLVWPNWEKFITGGDLGVDAPAAPYFPSFNVQKGHIGDYLGLPIQQIDKVSALPFAMYALIWNEYYRDQNLQAALVTELVDGVNSAVNYAVAPYKRAWQHDYFTAALPFAQKGAAVDIPLGDVKLKTTATNSGLIVDPTASHSPLSGDLLADTSPAGELRTTPDTPAVYDPNGSLEVGATTINNLRQAFRLQEFLEKNARAGSRYIENILAHFGVRSKDDRLNRPQYLGGSIQPMIISEVLQTSETGTSAQGNMAGHGVSVGDGREFSYRATEHGYVMTIMSVIPKTAYQQGIPKHFSRWDKLAYFWPSFAHLGEQEVLNREVYYDPADGVVNDATFGYIPRYAEYRYNPSRVAGDFRDNLAYWHLSRIFASRPGLNDDFIKCVPSHRIFAVTDPTVDKIYAHVFHQIKAVRKIPKYGTPTF